MTNAIEQSKRAYAQAMHDMTHFAKGCGPMTVERLRSLEDSVEEYLDILTQSYEALHETARKRFEDIQSLEAVNKDLREKIQYWRGLNSNQCASIMADGELIADLNNRITRMTESHE